MARPVSQKLVNLFLAAMVLAWNFAFSPIQHAHEGGGDLSHGHGCVDEIDGGYRLYRVSDCGYGLRTAAEPGVIAGLDAHHHFEWFGFQVTFPDADSPAQQGDHHDSGGKLLFVQGSCNAVFQVYRGGTLDKSPEFLSLGVIATDTVAARPAVSSSILPVTLCSLCDRARHERSGVLLA